MYVEAISPCEHRQNRIISYIVQLSDGTTLKVSANDLRDFYQLKKSVKVRYPAIQLRRRPGRWIAEVRSCMPDGLATDEACQS